MPVLYDVRTPLGQNRCDTEQEVTDRIAEYMRREGAVLNRASVIRVPETNKTVCCGGRAPTRVLLDSPD